MRMCDQDYADEAANAAYADDAPAHIQERADGMQLRRKYFVNVIRAAQGEVRRIMADDPNACHAPTGYDWSDVEALLDDFADTDTTDTDADVERLMEGEG